jgi:hypothetical protein
MMGKRWMYLVVVTLGLLLILVIGPGLAHGPEEQAQPQGTMAIEAVSSWYTYQGMLRENGVPVTGSRYIVFTFYADDACTVPYDDFWDTVEVNEGLFSVKLPGGSYYFDGRAVWLGMEIDGTTVGCQEIPPVPYALSLRPGAQIQRTDSGNGLEAINTATGTALWASSPNGFGVSGYSENSYAIYGSDGGTTQGKGYGGYFTSNTGIGVYGYSSATSVTANAYTPGVYGRSANGVGVYGWSDDGDAGVLGSSDGYGVSGRSEHSHGVRGYAGVSWPNIPIRQAARGYDGLSSARHW